MATPASAPTSEPRLKRTRAKLFDWKLLIGIIFVAGLVVLSSSPANTTFSVAMMAN